MSAKFLILLFCTIALQLNSAKGDEKKTESDPVVFVDLEKETNVEEPAPAPTPNISEPLLFLSTESGSPVSISPQYYYIRPKTRLPEAEAEAQARSDHGTEVDLENILEAQATTYRPSLSDEPELQLAFPSNAEAQIQPPEVKGHGENYRMVYPVMYLPSYNNYLAAGVNNNPTQYAKVSQQSEAINEPLHYIVTNGELPESENTNIPTQFVVAPEEETKPQQPQFIVLSPGSDSQYLNNQFVQLQDDRRQVVFLGNEQNSYKSLDSMTILNPASISLSSDNQKFMGTMPPPGFEPAPQFHPQKSKSKVNVAYRQFKTLYKKIPQQASNILSHSQNSLKHSQNSLVGLASALRRKYVLPPQAMIKQFSRAQPKIVVKMVRPYPSPKAIQNFAQRRQLWQYI